MIVRMLGDDDDWTFGRGKNNYLTENDAIGQSIETRLRSFLGDCFWDQGAGVDWFNLLGSKNLTGLILSVKTTILNTSGVTALTELLTDLDENRELSLDYSVQTVFGTPLTKTVDHLLTEDGDFLDDTYGNRIRT